MRKNKKEKIDINGLTIPEAHKLWNKLSIDDQIYLVSLVLDAYNNFFDGLGGL